ncbi:MAG: hypothetical protein U0L18_09160 [Acutalibacteraceae bacterium]|nr:hypothetical protein [Acutalibacteraceae bacterium]
MAKISNDKCKNSKEKSGEIITEFNPPWLEFIPPERFNNHDLYRIVTFFVFHSPCAQLSAMSHSLIDYGWDSPWRKPQYLQKKLKNASTNPDLIFSSQTIDDMRQALSNSNLLDDFPLNIEVERIAIYNNKKNQFMSIFYHLRNAFAHGRLNMFPLENEKDDYIFAFEDVKIGKTKKVTARMILRKSTLLKWINIIEKGYQE